jgi:hypothetical protein
MSAAGKIALGVASGYLLGRRKKMKLAITVGSMLAGKKIATDPRGLLKQLNELVEHNEELSKLADQIRGELFTAARSAAVATANSRMDGLSDAIRDRSDRMSLSSALGKAGDSEELEQDEEGGESEEGEEAPEDSAAEEESGEDAEEEPEEDAEESEDAEEEPEEDAEEEPEEAPAKKAAAKKAPAKKSSAAKKSTSSA